MVFNTIERSNKNNWPNLLVRQVPFLAQEAPSIKSRLVQPPVLYDRLAEYPPISVEYNPLSGQNLSDPRVWQAATILLNDLAIAFEAEQAEFVLSGEELSTRQNKVSADLVNLAQYANFSFDITAAVNMTSDNWDELDTLYEYGGVSYTEHIKLGQLRAQKLFDFLWGAVNDTDSLREKLVLLPEGSRHTAEANLQIVRENLLQFTDRRYPPKLLPEYQKLCYVYSAQKGAAPPLKPQDKTPVYTYEQSLNVRTPRAGITGLALNVITPGTPDISDDWQTKGEEVLIALEEAVAQQVKAEEEARVKAEEETRVKAEEEARAKAEEEARAKAEEEARVKAEEEARVKAEEEARAKAEEEARAKAEEEARAKAEEEARAKAEEEARAKAEEEARAKAEEEARAKAEEEARAKAEEETRVKAEEEARVKAEEEARAKAEEEARVKAEEEARAKAEEEARVKAEEETKKIRWTFSGGGYVRENEQAAWLQTTIVPRAFQPNIPLISSIKIGGGLNFGFHRKTERLIYQYLKPNAAPTADAGSDQTIALPTSSVTLDGSESSDSDGSIAAYEWTQVGGPVTATIGSPAGSSTSVSGLTTAGTYTFQLKVTDNDGAESVDTMTVTVVNAAPPPANAAPTANAGNDQTITLPTSSVNLDGSGSSDSDGSIAAYEWTQVSKPNGVAGAVIGSPAGSSTSVSGLTTAGTYTFQLKVTDNDGAESVDTVTVTVAPKIVTKNITIIFSNLPVQGYSGYGSLDLTHTLSAAGGWDDNFQADDISSQITGSANASDYNDGDSVTIIKNFYYDGQTIATLTVTAKVEDNGGNDFVFNDVSYNTIGTIEISKTISQLLPPPPSPSIMALPDNDIENTPFDTAGYTLENPASSSGSLRYIDNPDNPYALAEYFKNTMKFRILPHFDLEITGQKWETPLGSLTPFLRERFEIGVEFTAVGVEVAEAAPLAAVQEIEELAARDNTVNLILGNELQLFSALDLRAIPGHFTAGIKLQNRSYADDRYSASLKYLQDINYQALQSISAKITGGFTQTGAGLWRGDILANLLPEPAIKISRLTTGFNLFGEHDAFGIGATAIWRPLAFMEYGAYVGFQDVSRLNSLYGALTAKIYF
jgi:hypothetical protein